MNNTKTNSKHKIIYKMTYALALKEMGHKVVEVMPNPAKIGFNCWVFEIDDTLEEDFNKLRKGGSNE